MRYGWLLAAPLLSALQLSPAPAPPRSAAVRMTVSATPSAFGRDPRGSQLSDEKLAQLAEACKPVNPASASTSDSVTPILTIEDFEAALAHSASRGRLTVFKFYAPWCPAVLTRDPEYVRGRHGTPGARLGHAYGTRTVRVPYVGHRGPVRAACTMYRAPAQVPNVHVDQEELRRDGGWRDAQDDAIQDAGCRQLCRGGGLP